MNTLPFRFTRALFRATCGLPPGGRASNTAHAQRCRNEPPRVNLFRGIMEAVQVASSGSEAAEAPVGGLLRAIEAAGPRVTGFLRLEVDKQKKATGSFLLFSNDGILTGTVEGAASEGMDGRVEASFRLPPATARKLGTGQTVPVAVRCLRFDACDH